MSSFWNFFSDKENPEGSEEGEPSEEMRAAQAVGGTDGGNASASASAGSSGASTAPGPKASKAPAPPAAPPSFEGAAPPAKPMMPSPQKPNPRYGIDDAIRLMRTLPVDENVDLVVRVIKRTLESLSVRVPDIIEDASKRQDALRTKVAEHKSAIVQLEREIDARRFEISRLEDDLSETTLVRERLQLAEATALVPTPAAPKVLPGGTPLTPSSPPGAPGAPGASGPASKKPNLAQSQSSKAPPLPVKRDETTFRKPSTDTMKKVVIEMPATAAPAAPVPKVDVPTPAVPIVGGDDDEDEHPVESKDFEK